ncbi:MAG: S46 family peptidase [Chitinophagaceae bacterium]
MKNTKLFFLAVFITISSFAKADDGMWLPLLLDKLNEKQMKSLGMKISAKDIYSINTGSLKDAVVSFGGFCTGEVISSKGLVLTNHHCGFDAVQNHSTLDHNYIKNGFWSMNNGQELPNPGLFVTFIVRIEDVTKAALKGVTTDLTEAERQSMIERHIKEINAAVTKETYQKSFIRPFFEANQYYMFITETYTDIRLVGAPPASIGNFGHDTDNWMWPRHTGDFSLFRIYAGKDNKPAEYSPDNIPYTPKKSLSVSLDGVAEKDFTMVFGFSGKTTEYLPGIAVQQIVKVNDPAKIAVRDKALNILNSFMRSNEQIKIQYAAKYASMSNSWKKWQGEVIGLAKSDAVGKKKMYEAEFQKRVDANPQWKSQYGSLLKDLEAAYTEIESLGLARDYYTEITGKIELFTVFNRIKRLQQTRARPEYDESLTRFKDSLKIFYNEYNQVVDKKLFEGLMPMYVSKQVTAITDFSKWANDVYNATDLDDGEKTLALAGKDPDALLQSLTTDKAYGYYTEIFSEYSNTILPKLNAVQARINKLQRSYMQAQMDVFKEKAFYPDANSTLRVTYGNVKGYSARDAVQYDYYSYLGGAIEKYVPGDYEFDMPQKLRDLYAKKDYGQYGKNGKMPVCFIASNHTTGGNSGSPALDAYGNLVGLNFDRVWEGTMSDINYDPSFCRNIMVDIRYVLFIIDKYAGAGHLVKEMKLVHPKVR